MHCATLLFACLYSQAGSQAVPGVIEFPLTDLDVKLARTATAPAISVKSRTNESCLLTQRYVPASSGCTWRTSRRCSTKPVLRKLPVYDKGCLVDDRGVHSKDCKEVLRPVPTTHSLKVCNTTASPLCSSPCPDCALHCRETQSFWSQTSHVIRTKLRTIKICLDGEEKECSGPIRREEMEVIENVTNNFEKKGKVCAPINCKFEAPDGYCAETKDTILVQLRTKLCTVCEPLLEDKLESEEECEEVPTRDCHNDPLSKPWKKFCTNTRNESNAFNSSYEKTMNDTHEEPRTSKVSLKPNVIFDNLFDKSLNPVNSLIQESLKANVHSSGSEESKFKASKVTSSKKTLTLSPVTNNDKTFELKNEIPSSKSNLITILNYRNRDFKKPGANPTSKTKEGSSIQTSKPPTTTLKSSSTTPLELEESSRSRKLTTPTTLKPNTQKPIPSVETLLYPVLTRNTSLTTPLTELPKSDIIEYTSNSQKSTLVSSITITTPSTLIPMHPTVTSVYPKITKTTVSTNEFSELISSVQNKSTLEMTSISILKPTPQTQQRTTTAKPIKTSNSITGHKVLLSEFLKRCFQDFRDPSCDFSDSVDRASVESQIIEVPHKITISPIITTTTQSLEKKVQQFNLLFELTTPSTTKATTTTRSTTTSAKVDREAEKIKAKVQAELRAAFLVDRT